MLSYTPAIGEKGVILWAHHYDWSGGIYASVSQVQVWLDGGTNYFGKYYAYEKTDATTITLTLLDDEQTWTQPQQGSAVGPEIMPITGALVLINNSGTIETSGAYAGSNFSTSTTINYSGYNEAGTIDASFFFQEGALNVIDKRFWVNDGADNDNDNPNNWAAFSGGTGGAGVPTTTHEVYFDTGSGANDITLTAQLNSKFINADANYSGNFDQNQQAITCDAGKFEFNGTGNLTIDGGLIRIGGDFLIGAGVGTYNQNGAELQFTTNGSFSVGVAGSTSNAIKTLYIDSGVKVVINSKSMFRNDNNTSIVLADSTSIFELGAGGEVDLYNGGICKPIEDNGGTVTAVTGYRLNFEPQLANSTITLPKIDAGNALVLNLRSYFIGTTEYLASDNITCREIATEQLAVYTSGNVIDFDTNGYNLILSQSIRGKQAVGANSTITNTYLRSGNHSLGLAFDFSQDATSIYNLFLGTGTTDTQGPVVDFTGLGTVNVDAGTSAVKLNGTANQDLTLGGASLYDVEIDNIGGGVTLIDGLDCNTLTTTNGDFDTNLQDITCVSEFDLNNTSDITTLDGVIAFSSDATFSIGDDSGGALSSAGATVIFQGSGVSTFQHDWASNQQWGVIKGGNGASAVLNLRSNDTATVLLVSQLEILHVDGEINKSKRMELTGSTPFANSNGALTGSDTLGISVPSGITTLYFPDLTGHVANATLISYNSSALSTVNVQNNIAIGAGFGVVCSAYDADIIFNLNGYDINLTQSLSFTANYSLADLVFNPGVGATISCVDVIVNVVNASILNMGTGTWQFSGDFTITELPTLNKDTSTLEANGTGVQTITSNGKTFNILKTTNTTGELQLLDASHCSRYDFSPATTIKFKEGVTHILDGYTVGDMDGAVGNPVTVLAVTDGSEANFDNPSGMVVSYVSVKGNYATNRVDTSDGTSLNLGNTKNWFLDSTRRFNQPFNQPFNQVFN